MTSQNYISPTARKNIEKGKSSVSQVVSRFSPSKCHITKIAQQCKLCLPLRTLRHKIALPPGVANLFSSPCFWRLFQAFGLKCILILVLVCCTFSRSKPGLSICELQYNEILSFTRKSFHLSNHMLCYSLQLPTQNLSTDIAQSSVQSQWCRVYLAWFIGRLITMVGFQTAAENLSHLFISDS